MRFLYPLESAGEQLEASATPSSPYRTDRGLPPWRVFDELQLTRAEDILAEIALSHRRLGARRDLGVRQDELSQERLRGLDRR